jgi:hypothetical protein
LASLRCFLSGGCCGCTFFSSLPCIAIPSRYLTVVTVPPSIQFVKQSDEPLSVTPVIKKHPTKLVRSASVHDENRKPAQVDKGTRSSRIVEVRSSIGLRSHNCKKRGLHG